jgi:hypothetical protein
VSRYSVEQLTKEDVVDIVNVSIEILVRHRYELPAFRHLIRQHEITQLLECLQQNDEAERRRRRTRGISTKRLLDEKKYTYG